MLIGSLRMTMTTMMMTMLKAEDDNRMGYRPGAADPPFTGGGKEVSEKWSGRNVYIYIYAYMYMYLNIYIYIYVYLLFYICYV